MVVLFCPLPSYFPRYGPCLPVVNWGPPASYSECGACLVSFPLCLWMSMVVAVFAWARLSSLSGSIAQNAFLMDSHSSSVVVGASKLTGPVIIGHNPKSRRLPSGVFADWLWKSITGLPLAASLCFYFFWPFTIHSMATSLVLLNRLVAWSFFLTKILTSRLQKAIRLVNCGIGFHCHQLVVELTIHVFFCLVFVTFLVDEPAAFFLSRLLINDVLISIGLAFRGLPATPYTNLSCFWLSQLCRSFCPILACKQQHRSLCLE